LSRGWSTFEICSCGIAVGTWGVAGAGISDNFLLGMHEQQKAGAKEDTDNRGSDEPNQNEAQQAADRKRRRWAGEAARHPVWRR
jgi:hypothetical protein